MNLLVKKDVRIIDIDDGFIVEAYVEQTVDYNHKVYVTHTDYPDIKYLISSVVPQRGVALQGEASIVRFLQDADNYKEVWLDKLKEIYQNRQMFERQ